MKKFYLVYCTIALGVTLLFAFVYVLFIPSLWR